MTLPPKQPHFHRHVTCRRHPAKPVTGFCASCLRERLSGIDPDTHVEAPLTHLVSELRRSKSHSASAASSSAAAISEPRRRSCDVGPRSTLSDLFHVDDRNRKVSSTHLKFKGLGFDLGIEIKEQDVLENVGEIRVSQEEFDDNGELKTMKEFIDLEWERKRSGRNSKYYGNVGRSFWEAACLFSKKLEKWQNKHKKRNEDKDKEEVKTEKEERRNFGSGFGRWSVGKLRETQSEVGEYGFGRRSCDTNPRLSVDAGFGARLSVDDSRWSFDEPRASYDGCLVGNGRMHHHQLRLVPPLISVMEDVKLGSEEGVEDKEGNVGLENGGHESCSPGGTAQTRDYYCSGRRRSFDRLGSVRRVGLGDEELKSMWNAKVSPETVGLFHGAKLLVTEKELRDSNWYAVKDCHTESVDSVSRDAGSVTSGAGKKDLGLKRMPMWRGVWNMWGLMQRKREGRCREEESGAGENMIDGAMEESLQKLKGIANGVGNGVVNQKLIRSYTVSARDSCKMAGSTTGCGCIEAKDSGTKKKEEILFQQSRSVRYSPSPNNLNNGLLRFYLTPLRNYGRSKSGKSRLKNSMPIARDVL